MKKAVIYVSSNKENVEFERKTREDLIEKAGDLPIVGVTQKAVDLGKNGKNIVVGDVGVSCFNFLRQVLMACENADADVVVSAESDCIYVPEYFKFEPEKLDIPYRNMNSYVQHFRNDYFFKKGSVTSSQVIGRQFYIDRLTYLFEGQPEWCPEMKNFPKEIKKKLFNEFEYFETEYPNLSFKTGKGMRHYTVSDRMPRHELPYWGKSKDVIERFLG